jgi:mannose-6-phosphate isomerase-like protein (cupin superfamily)
MGRKTALGRKTSKIWGVTSCIFESPYAEMHYIEANKGGYCSRHHHITKYNTFYVINGKLQITIYNGENIETTILNAGESMDVPAMIDHRFEALENTRAIEIYWVDKLESEDIIRKDSGGRRNNLNLDRDGMEFPLVGG